MEDLHDGLLCDQTAPHFVCYLTHLNLYSLYFIARPGVQYTRSLPFLRGSVPAGRRRAVACLGRRVRAL